jgi:hypothetical protein
MPTHQEVKKHRRKKRKSLKESRWQKARRDVGLAHVQGAFHVGQRVSWNSQTKFGWLSGRVVETRVKFPGTPEMTRVLYNVVLDDSPFGTFSEVWAQATGLKAD